MIIYVLIQILYLYLFLNLHLYIYIYIFLFSYSHNPPMLHIMRAAISNQFVAPQRGTETASATKPDRGMARHLMDVVTHCCFQDIIRLRSLKCACVCACACVFVSSAWGNLWRDIDIFFLALRTNPLTKVCAAPAGSSAV